MSSFSVNARGHAPGSVIAAYLRWSRAIASTRLAGARSAAQTMRLRCEPISIPYEAMTETTSGCGRSPPPIIPAERTGTVTPSVASRRASSAAAIGDRHTFAVHSTTMPASPGSSGSSRCAQAAETCPMLSMPLIAILPENSLRPLFMKMAWLIRAGNHPQCGTSGHETPGRARPGIYRCTCRTLILPSECRVATSLRRLFGFQSADSCYLPIREKVIMTEFGSEPSFRTYLQIMRQRKWWVGSITVLGLAVSLAFSLTAHKQYSATAQLLVQPTVYAGSVGAVQEPVTQTEVETELQLVASAPVQQAVRNRLKSTPAVSASEVGQTNVMAITAMSAVPSQAALIANLYATAFVQYRQEVASHSLATAEAQLRSQISSIGQQIGSLRGNTTSPEATALLNQDAVLKEQLAQMQVSGANDTGDVVLVTPAQTPTGHAPHRAAARRHTAGGPGEARRPDGGGGGGENHPRLVGPVPARPD